MFSSHDNEDVKSQSQRHIVLLASLLSVEYASGNWTTIFFCLKSAGPVYKLNRFLL